MRRKKSVYVGTGSKFDYRNQSLASLYESPESDWEEFRKPGGSTHFSGVAVSNLLTR